MFLFLAGLGGLFCESVYAQAAHPVVHVRFQWIDPENKFGEVDSRRQAIETAVKREISTNANNLYSFLERTTNNPGSTSAAEWVVELEVETRELTAGDNPEKWWRVRLNHYLKHGDDSKLITRSADQILYDFDDFPPFRDAATLQSDLVNKVYEQLGRFDEAVVIFKLALASDSPRDELVARYEEKGRSELAGFLWEFIEAGGSWTVVDIALDALADSDGTSAESQAELLSVTSVALSQMEFNPKEFAESGLRDRIKALRTDPAIRGGVNEIVELYNMTGRILDRLGSDELLEANRDEVAALHRQLASEQYEWWSSARDRPDRGPGRGMSPADGFRELVRTLGSLIKRGANTLSDQDPRSGEYYRFAESYYRLAADLRSSEVDPAAVRELVRLKVETDELPAVEKIRDDYESRIVETERSALSNNQLKKTFDYHKTLGGLYTQLIEWGDASKAPKAVYQLDQARRNSYQLEDQMSGELPDAYRFNREMSFMLELACNAGGNCGPPVQPPLPSAIAQNYIGDDIRIAIGYDSETDLTGELFWNFLDDSDSAYSFEGWKGADSSGGLKLNFHWLADGVLAGKDSESNQTYSDGKVRKLFIAADRNVFDDGKLTLGGGGERRDRFWSLYASKAMTGERYLGSTIEIETRVTSGETDDYHQWIQTETWTTTTEFLAHPYHWGLGFRIGRHFEGSLVRLRGGLDYEFGDYSSSQATAFIGLDKRFEGTGHGLSLRAEFLRKQGDFETDQGDVRISAFWSWDFGTTFLPSGTVPVECIVDFSALPAEEATGGQAAWIQRALRNPAAHKRSVDYYRYNRVTEQHDSEFELINEGPVAKNDTYSVDRDSTGNVLPVLDNDIDPENDYLKIVSVSDPAHGTVEISGESVLLYTPDAGFTGKDTFTYVIEEMHRTTPHPRGPESTATVTINVKNSPPVAVDDDYEVDKNSYDNPFDVLMNDSDPDGDPISIVSATRPMLGDVWVGNTIIKYTPPEGYCGTDSFTYRIEDDKGGEDMASVTVTVINKPPVARDDHAETYKNRSVVIDVLANDFDPDGDPITVLDIILAEHPKGTVEDNGDGTLTYSPTPGWWGGDSFQYTIIDDCGGTATATVTLDVI